MPFQRGRATFTGLIAGDYSYQLSGMTSADWENINSFTSNWAGTVRITGTSTGGGTVPEPSSLALLGLGLVGLCTAGIRRRPKA